MIKKLLIYIAHPVLFLFPQILWAGYPLNLTRGVTPISKEVYDLHMLVLWIVVIIAVLVFSVLFWSIFHHRKSKGAVAAQFHHSTAAEVAWTIIPVLILVGMAIPATKTLILMEKTEDAEISVKVTGYQWKWKYDYMDEGFGFFSKLSEASEAARQMNAKVPFPEHYLLDVDKPLVLPVDTKIRILTTAADVIHAWWVPDFGWKRDAIPGFINDNWVYIEEPGVYRGQCAELCGRDHGFMPIVVNAVSREEYDNWVVEQKTVTEKSICESGPCTSEQLMAAGETLYGQQCAVCHQAQGQGIEGVFPALDGSPLVKGPAQGHIEVVLQGKKLMPAFAGQLSDEELAAVITFERNAWGNKTGDVVLPEDVKALR